MSRFFLLLALLPATAGSAQTTASFQPRGAIRTPAQAEQARIGGAMRELERTLNGIRFRHFDGAKPTEAHADGVAALEAALAGVTTPSKYTVALEVFRRSDPLARSAVLEVMAADGTDSSLGALVFLACRDDEAYSARAAELVLERAKLVRESDAALWVVQRMLAQPDVYTAERAAHLVNATDMVEAVPMLIVTQTFSYDDGRSQALGTGEDIQVKQDPNDHLWFNLRLKPDTDDLGEGRSGIVDYEPLRTSPFMPRDYSRRASHQQTDFYRGAVHDALVDVTTRAWGRPTDHMGWDVEVWKKWYVEEFQPAMLAKRAAEQAPPVQTPAQP